MSELRYNPLLDTWTMVAANRQKRPDMPKNWCPFCPDGGKVPNDFDVLLYPNDYPVLSPEPETVDDENFLYQKMEAYGRCDVVLYSPQHEIRLHELSDTHIVKLIDLWQKRSNELSADEDIKYVFVFENRGAEVGVTMPHPHGQIYSYPFVPLKIETELWNCKAYYQQTDLNLFDVMNQSELEFGERIIMQTESFLAYIPFFTDYPFGVFIVSKDDTQHFADFTEQHKKDLAFMLKKITRGMDNLYNKLFPYMMCVHQAPINEDEWEDSVDYYRFHIEFYPPLRAENSIKHLAGSETGGWAAANTVLVEDAAKQLREAMEK